jgi:hypothetical protein
MPRSILAPDRLVSLAEVRIQSLAHWLSQQSNRCQISGVHATPCLR